MLRSMLVAAVVAGSAALMGLPAADAAPASGLQTRPVTSQTLIEQVQGRYCRRWYRECRERWGGGPDFRRCMRRHGC